MKHQHDEGFECESCRDGIEAVQEKEKRLLKDPGWITHFVGDATPNIHTHGLVEKFGHPDFQICVGMPPKHAHTFFTIAIENIKLGASYEANQRYDDIISPAPDYAGMKYEVLFLEAEEGGRKVLRMIFPEKDGSFIGKMSDGQMQGCVIPEGLNRK